LRLAYLDGWGSDDTAATPTRDSRFGTWAAAIAGAVLGMGVVGLYAGGVLDGATLGETPSTASREPSWSMNPEYARAVEVQARALASGTGTLEHVAAAVAAPTSPAPAPTADTPASPLSDAAPEAARGASPQGASTDNPY